MKKKLGTALVLALLANPAMAGVLDGKYIREKEGLRVCKGGDAEVVTYKHDEWLGIEDDKWNVFVNGKSYVFRIEATLDKDLDIWFTLNGKGKYIGTIDAPTGNFVLSQLDENECVLAMYFKRVSKKDSF